MFKWLVTGLILVNFWGVLLINRFIYPGHCTIVPYNEFTQEVITELCWVSVILVIISSFCFKLKKHVVPTPICKIRHGQILLAIYVAFIISKFLSINWSLDNSLRGVDQFNLANRSGLKGFLSALGDLYLPFILFAYHYRVFGRRTVRMILALILVAVAADVTNGGRRTVSYLAITALLYFYYYRGVSIKKIFLFLFPAAVLLMLAMIARDTSVNYGPKGDIFLTSLLQTNSDPSFLWGVKAYLKSGISMGGVPFFYHFLSILLPSFLLIKITGQISYPRAVFLFDKLFNSNPNQGYDFMLLADFYWNFENFGYVLYILMVMFVFWYFKRNVYSEKTYKGLAAILMVMFMGQQRNDFGAILHPIVYYFVFLCLLHHIFICGECRKLK